MPKSTLKKTPEWREFEKLVIKIEHALTPHGATVKSPDRIRSLLTNRLRDVDASIRTKIGSTEILITVECRKRRAKQDVTWLEQLKSKKTAIGATKTIAVSASEFSSDAITVAAAYGIDLRVLRDITDEDIESWLFPRSFIHMYKYVDLLAPPSVQFEMLAGDTKETFDRSNRAGFNEKVFLNSDDERLSLDDIVDTAQQQLDLYSSVPTNGEAIKVKLEIDGADNLKVISEVGLRNVKKIILQCALSWRKEEIPLEEARLVEYVNPSNNSAPSTRRAEFETKKAKNNLRIGLQRESNSDKFMITAEMIGLDKNES